MVAGTQLSEKPSTTARHLRQIPPIEPDYLEYVATVRRVVVRVGRRYQLNQSDIEDLQSDLWVKLLADNGLTLRRFRGTAQIGTYLSKVAVNLVLDRRNHEWGKWRPCAVAVRNGPIAIQLDRLLSRDGLTFEQALASLESAGFDVDVAALDRMARLLPPRAPRRIVGAEDLNQCVAGDASPYERIRLRDRRRASARIAVSLARAIDSLSQSDRDLLAWRYRDNRTVAAIAVSLNIDQKQLYRRFDTLLSRLRNALAVSGVGPDAITDLLVGNAAEITCTLRGTQMPRRPLRRSA